MTDRRLFLVILIVGASIPVLWAEPESATSQLSGVDGSALAAQLSERAAKIQRLPASEQEALRAAQQDAIEDPAVKEALAKRDRAMAEFQQTFLDAMVKADPKVAPILIKMSEGANRGF